MKPQIVHCLFNREPQDVTQELERLDSIEHGLGAAAMRWIGHRFEQGLPLDVEPSLDDLRRLLPPEA